MEIQRPLFLHQGLFLQPQHFQLLDLSFQSLLAPYHSFSAPHFWGTGAMDVQKTALGTKSFQLLTGSFLFPDGTYAVFPGNGLIEARSFDEAWIEGGKPFPVLIGLKKWNDAGENVTILNQLESLSEVATRFVAFTDPEEVKDLHSGGPKGQVKRLYYVLKIFWERERTKLGDYLLMPIAHLERMGEEVRFSERFISPCLTLSSSDQLLKITREIRDQIAARSQQLEQ